jgi:hypothetical protein
MQLKKWQVKKKVASHFYRALTKKVQKVAKSGKGTFLSSFDTKSGKS